MPADAVTVRARHADGACLLLIAGELDVAVADGLAIRAAVAVLGIPGPVLLDLSGLTFIDARGAQALDSLIRQPPDGRPTALRCCPLHVRRILDILQLPLDYPQVAEGVVRQPAVPPLASQVRQARLEAGQSRLESARALSRLADTCIRLASTRERSGLVREQGRQALAGSRAARRQLIAARPDLSPPVGCNPVSSGHI